jgi:hypothetical protein
VSWIFVETNNSATGMIITAYGPWPDFHTAEMKRRDRHSDLALAHLDRWVTTRTVKLETRA